MTDLVDTGVEKLSEGQRDKRGSGQASGAVYAWYVVTVLAIVHALSVGDRYIMGLVVESVKLDVGLTDTQLGLIQGPAFLVMFCLLAVPLGLLADTSPRKWLIAGGIMIWSGATAMTGVADSFLTLAAARAFVGLGEAALVPAGLSLISSYMSADRMGRATGLFTVGATLGKGIAFMGGGALIGYLGVKAGAAGLVAGLEPWRWVFLVAGAPGVLITLLLLLTVREPSRPPPAPVWRILREGLAYMRENLATYAGMVAGICACYGVTLALAAWAVSFFVRVHGVSIAQAGALVGFLALTAGPAGAMVGSLLSDRLTARGVGGGPVIIISGGLVCMVAASTFFIAFAQNPVMGAIGYGLVQLCLSACVPNFFAGTQIVTPEAYRGSVTSILLVTYLLIGGSLGPTVVGVLTDNVFTTRSGLAPALWLTASTLGLVGAVACYASRGAFARTVLRLNA